MKVVGREILEEFKKKHADARGQIDAWLAEAEEAAWESPNDIKARYSSVSFVGDNRVIFNIKGNNYRLDIKVSFKPPIVLIKRIGTHAEYDKWDF